MLHECSCIIDFLNEFYRFFGKRLINSRLNKNNTGARSKYTNISRTSQFHILGVLTGIFHIYSNCNSTSI